MRVRMVRNLLMVALGIDKVMERIQPPGEH